MQSKAQLIKELSQYTKEDIIEAIADTDNILANRIISKLFKVKSKNIDALVDAAYKKWQQANDEYQAYLKQINKEYKDVSIFELPAEVSAKLIKLSDVEEQADIELEAMYKKQDKLYEKIR